MDWQGQLIHLFVYISKHHKHHLEIYCQRLSPNACPEFSDEEVITVYLWGVLRGHQEIKAIHSKYPPAKPGALIREPLKAAS